MGIPALEFEYLRKLMRDHAAIQLDSGKEYIAECRLAHVASQEGFASVGQLVRELRASPRNGLHRKVVDAMTNNETWFFRDLLPYEALRKAVLPPMMAARAGEKRLEIWSAACSSGQEPYSLAMSLRENFPELSLWKVHILATDISSAILARAQKGHYSQLEINRGLPAALLARYFRREGLDWVIAEELKRNIEFRSFNLAEPWGSMSNMDVIFLRNVLIYFDVETKKRILGQVRRFLKPDGCLFLGGAETTLNLDDSFERVQYENTAYYRLRK